MSCVASIRKSLRSRLNYARGPLFEQAIAGDDALGNRPRFFDERIRFSPGIDATRLAPT